MDSRSLYFIGDSQAKRLANSRLFHEFAVTDWGLSGKRCDEVLNEVRNKIRERNKQGIRVEEDAIVVIWVGTNDIMQGKSQVFTKHFKQLIKYCKRLFRRHCHFVICSLPPILKYPHRTKEIKHINKYICSFVSPRIKIIDLFDICTRGDGSVRSELYMEFMGQNNNQREDRLHLNFNAHEIIATRIREILREGG